MLFFILILFFQKTETAVTGEMSVKELEETVTKQVRIVLCINYVLEHFVFVIFFFFLILCQVLKKVIV